MGRLSVELPNDLIRRLKARVPAARRDEFVRRAIEAALAAETPAAVRLGDAPEPGARAEPPPAAGGISLATLVQDMDLLLADDGRSYLNRRTGETFLVTPDDRWVLDRADDAGMPDWQRDMRRTLREIEAGGDWIALPSRHEFHEHAVMERFCHAVDQERQRAALLDAIRGRGAFRRFNELIRRYDIDREWQDFRAAAFERFIADWLESKGIPFGR